VLQVEATCCAQYSQVLLSAANFSFAAHITTYFATNLNSTFVIGCREAQQIVIKKNMAYGEGEPEFEVQQ